MNKVIVLGHLGNDPEYYEGVNKNNEKFQTASFSICTSKSYKDKEGNWQDIPTWHKARVFGNLAPAITQNLLKGHQVLIEGQLKYEHWEKEGVKVSSAYIEIHSFKKLTTSTK